MSPRLHFFPAALLIFVLSGLVWSGIQPRDRLTWLLEVIPVLIVIPVLVLTYRRFRLTSLAYCLIAGHAWLLMIGGHYTYAKMPLFNWLRDEFAWSRNHYDRLGHIAQGFVPAIVVREILLRTSPLRRGGWLFTLVVCVCMAVSAAYELAEWLAAECLQQSADAFLATQGDTWDTQKDMLLALLGSIAAQLMLARFHDRNLLRLGVGESARAK